MKEYTMLCRINNKGVEDEYPDDLDIEVSFNTSGHISDVVNGFKHFLRASGFSDILIDQYITDDMLTIKRK